jgi:hypothetical protein
LVAAENPYGARTSILIEINVMHKSHMAGPICCEISKNGQITTPDVSFIVDRGVMVSKRGRGRSPFVGPDFFWIIPAHAGPFNNPANECGTPVSRIAGWGAVSSSVKKTHDNGVASDRPFARIVGILILLSV